MCGVSRNVSTWWRGNKAEHSVPTDGALQAACQVGCAFRCAMWTAQAPAEIPEFSSASNLVCAFHTMFEGPRCVLLFATNGLHANFQDLSKTCRALYSYIYIYNANIISDRRTLLVWLFSNLLYTYIYIYIVTSYIQLSIVIGLKWKSWSGWHQSCMAPLNDRANVVDFVAQFFQCYL